METSLDVDGRPETLPSHADITSSTQNKPTSALNQQTIRAKLQTLRRLQATRSRKPVKEVEVLRQKTFSFEHAHPDLAEEHFLRRHQHNIQTADITDSNSVRSLSRCTSPIKGQSGSYKRPWKPAVTPADQDIPSDKETGVVACSVKSKRKMARKGAKKTPHQALQSATDGSDAKAFAHLESKISILQQIVQTLMGTNVGMLETLAAGAVESTPTKACAAQEADVPLVGLPSCSELRVATAQCSSSRPGGGSDARGDASTSVDWWQYERSGSAEVPVTAPDDWMDYYRDPDSIEAAAAARRCLALLAEQAARQPTSSTSPPRTADGIPDVRLKPGSDAQSRPGTGRSRRSYGVHGSGQETIMQIKMRQDMELRAAEETSHRYARILEQQAERMRAYHEHSRQVLSQLEAPFSFHQRDKERAAAAAAAVAAAAEREAEIPKPIFKAKPAPDFIRKRAQEFRLRRHERQVLAAQQQALQALSKCRQPASLGQPKQPQNLPHRHNEAEKLWLRSTMEESVMGPSMSVMDEVRRLEGRDKTTQRSKHGGLVNASDREEEASVLANWSGRRQMHQPEREVAGLEGPAVETAARPLVAGSRSAAYKAGKVPNFAALHASWAKRLAAAKAAVQRGLTVPKASRLTERRPQLASAGSAKDRKASSSFTGQKVVGRAKSQSGSHAGFQSGLHGSCEDSFSELHGCAGIRRSAFSAADLEQWFAVQGRLQRKAALLIEKIAYVKQGCYSMLQHIGVQD